MSRSVGGEVVVLVQGVVDRSWLLGTAAAAAAVDARSSAAHCSVRCVLSCVRCWPLLDVRVKRAATWQKMAWAVQLLTLAPLCRAVAPVLKCTARRCTVYASRCMRHTVCRVQSAVSGLAAQAFSAHNSKAERTNSAADCASAWTAAGALTHSATARHPAASTPAAPHCPPLSSRRPSRDGHGLVDAGGGTAARHTRYAIHIP